MIHISQDYGYQAFRILQAVFILALVLMGLSGIFQIGGETYDFSLRSFALIKKNERVFSLCLGGLEILLGIGLVFKPWIFGYVLSACFFALLANFLVVESHLAVFLASFCLMLSAFSLGKLSQKYMPN